VLVLIPGYKSQLSSLSLSYTYMESCIYIYEFVVYMRLNCRTVELDRAPYSADHVELFSAWLPVVISSQKVQSFREDLLNCAESAYGRIEGRRKLPSNIKTHGKHDPPSYPEKVSSTD
jgi:hypothetical protein